MVPHWVIVVITVLAAVLAHSSATTPASDIAQTGPRHPIQPAVNANNALHDDKQVFQVVFKPTKPLVTPPIPTTAHGNPSSHIETSEPKQPTKLRAQDTNEFPQAKLTTNPTVPTIPTILTTPTRTIQTPTFVMPTTTAIPPTPTISQTLVAQINPNSLDFHRTQFEELKQMRTQVAKQLVDAYVTLASVDHEIDVATRSYEESHAALVVQDALPSPRGATIRELTCMGWKKTSQCRWNGHRSAIRDQSCVSPVKGGAGGYCEVKDDETDEYFRVMKVNCTSMPTTATLWCALAPQFANFPAEMERILTGDTTTTLELTTNGIVMVVELSQCDQAQETIRALRAVHCQLPIELWYFDTQVETALRAIAQADRLVTLHAITTTIDSASESSQAAAFANKIHAIAHSSFSSVLYLDVSVSVVRDPTYLFALPEFTTHTAIFWPDLFHPTTTRSNIQPFSLVWELFDLPPVYAFEQDDRQLLINRAAPRVGAALRLVEWFASHQPNLLEQMSILPKGKDFFRFAWLKAKLPFYMVPVPPSLGGGELRSPGSASPFFCGTRVVQHDPQGELLFIHKQSGDGSMVAAEEFPVLQVFDWRRDDGTPLSDHEIMGLYQITSTQRQVLISGGDKRPSDDSTPLVTTTTTTKATRLCFSHATGSPGGNRVITKKWKDDFSGRARN